MTAVDKRPWGTGTVSKHRDGWRARLPDADRTDVGVFPTRAEAAAALAAALAHVAVVPLEAPTLATWGAAWLGRRGVRDGTLRRDRDRWRTYVERSDLGAERIGRVTTGDVERWLAALAHLAPQTRANALGLVKGALAADAKERGVESVAAGVTVGKRQKTHEGWDWLRAREIGAVMACPLLPKQRALFTVATFTGLRAGELYGLRWGDVDLERGVLHVRHSRAEAPKNGKPREVPLLIPARVAIERWREHFEREQIRTYLDLVFPSPTGGYHDDGYDADWPEVRVLAGIRRPVRFHDLRHTFASHVLQGTWAPKWIARPLRLEEVRDLLGHADIKTTQRYSHLCRDAIAALVAKPSQQPRPGMATRSVDGRPPNTKPGRASFDGAPTGAAHHSMSMAREASPSPRSGAEAAASSASLSTSVASRQPHTPSIASTLGSATSLGMSAGRRGAISESINSACDGCTPTERACSSPNGQPASALATQPFSGGFDADGMSLERSPSPDAKTSADAQLGTGLGTPEKPPRRFELRTYGLRKRGPDPVTHEESATPRVSVPSLVPRLEAARDRLLAALESSDPWRDQRALDLVDVVDDLLDAVDADLTTERRRA